MAIKKTLLEITQDILSVLDSDEVNSLSDSLEATQIVEVIEATYYDIITQRDLPEHKSFTKLTALSDSAFPTHFKYPTNSNSLLRVWYDTSDDGSFKYEEIEYLEPLDFVCMLDSEGDNYTLVDDKTAGTKLRIRNNRQPQHYTSFDDEHIVMDSYNSLIDATLTEAKSRAYGKVYPVFNRTSDSFVPDLDGDQFPYLIAEAKSRAMDIFKGGSTAKVEQAARRNKVSAQSKKHRTTQPRGWTAYGR